MQLARLLLARSLILATAATILAPSRLRRATKDRTALFWADIAPPRSTQANGRSLDRCLRELSTGKIEHFDRQIEQRFGRQSALLHDTPQPCGAPRTKEASQFGGKRYPWILRLLRRFLGT